MTFEEEKTAFYSALGEAIAQWSNVEAHLYIIFLACLSPANHQVAAAVFYATEGFRIKLDMTDAAVAVALAGQPELEHWVRLSRAVRKRSRKRNELAHHDVFADERCKEGKRVLLIDAWLDPLRREAGSLFEPQGPGFHELRIRCSVFRILANRLREFHLTYGKGAPYYVDSEGFVATRSMGEKP